MDTTPNFTDKSGKSSKGIDIPHVVDILKAAFPHLDSDSQQSVDLFVKAGELISTVTELSQDHHPVASLSVRRQSINFEALLTSVREVSYPREREFIDMILNIFKVKSFYQTYTNLSQLMASQSQGAEGFEGSENYPGSDLFSNLASMFGMGGMGGMSGMSGMSGMNGMSDSDSDSDSDSGNGSGNGSGMNGNPAMMEMLISMLTPEQKSTFDNLSMLLNTMPQS